MRGVGWLLLPLSHGKDEQEKWRLNFLCPLHCILSRKQGLCQYHLSCYRVSCITSLMLTIRPLDEDMQTDHLQNGLDNLRLSE